MVRFLTSTAGDDWHCSRTAIPSHSQTAWGYRKRFCYPRDQVYGKSNPHHGSRYIGFGGHEKSYIVNRSSVPHCSWSWPGWTWCSRENTFSRMCVIYSPLKLLAANFRAASFWCILRSASMKRSTITIATHTFIVPSNIVLKPGWIFVIYISTLLCLTSWFYPAGWKFKEVYCPPLW